VTGIVEYHTINLIASERVKSILVHFSFEPTDPIASSLRSRKPQNKGNELSTSLSSSFFCHDQDQHKMSDLLTFDQYKKSDLPSFHRPSERLPLPGIDSGFFDIWESLGKRAFELTVDLEELVRIEDAAEHLVELVFDNFKKPCSDDSSHNFFWLSEDIVVSDIQIGLSGTYEFMITLDHNEVVEDRLLSISEVPTGDVKEETSTNNIGSAIDILLRLLAKHKSISKINLVQDVPRDIFWNPCPASETALVAFVSEAASPRTLSLEDDGFSVGQWHAIMFHCSKNITLEYCYHGMNDGSLEVFIEAMKANQCPAQLSFTCNVMHKKVLHDFLSALESTRSLQSLELYDNWCIPEWISVLAAVAKNRSLQRLQCFSHASPDRTISWSDTQWDIVFSLMESHPTLRSLEFELPLAQSSRTPERDRLFVNHASRNQVICEFPCLQCLFHDSDYVQRALRPVLEMNRIRPLVQAIQHETNEVRALQLLSLSLHGHHISENASCRFLLLKETAKMLDLCARPQLRMHRKRQQPSSPP